MTERFRRTARMLLGGACIALAACGGDGSAPRPAQPAPEPAELVEGDLHVRASAVPTMQLPESVAREYGIARAERRVLLLVAMRRGPEGNETAVTGRVAARATDLQGRVQAVPLRELRTGELVDYVGTLDVAPPETLRFQVEATPADGPARTLEFAREFYP